MEYRTLPGTDLRLPRLVLGTMTFGAQVDREVAGTMVDRCRDEGITMFDTANSYNAGASEQILGEIVAPFRADVLIASKVFNPVGDGSSYRGLRRAAIKEALEATLRRLAPTTWICTTCTLPTGTLPSTRRSVPWPRR